MPGTYKQQNERTLKLNSDCIPKRYTNILKETRRTCKACLRGTATA